MGPVKTHLLKVWLKKRPFCNFFKRTLKPVKFRFKGKAFIIVDGKRDAAIDTLAHVLAKTDNILMGRRIRIEIYQVK